MLLVHETHTVRGGHMEELERAYRDELMPALAEDDDARLLWYLHHAHGTGPGYTVVTITAVRDGVAWERLARRAADGDLRQWAVTVGRCCHRSVGKILLFATASPLHDIDLSTVPTTVREREPVVYMEDTGWPHGPLDAYVRFWDEDYRARIAARPPDERLLEIDAILVTAHGSGARPEAILLQRILDIGRLLRLLSTPTSEHRRDAHDYMAAALAHRDRWRSRLLRTAPWSPLP
jgi:hypothetical protein